MNFLDLIALFKDPKVIAIILGALGALRVIGALLVKIGELNPKEDWFDSAGSFLLKLVGTIGKLLSYIGIGNNSKRIIKQHKKIMLKK